MSSKKKADVNKFKVVFGYTLLFISIILFTSFISYMYNWRIDQSSVDSILDRDIQVENILGKIGASISHLLIFKLFGIDHKDLYYLHNGQEQKLTVNEEAKVVEDILA